ncbi:MAG: arylsulfatase [Bacteroidota bacterium]
MYKYFPILLFSIIILSCNTENKEKLPNIIIVLTDDQGYGDLSVHGSPDVLTPNLDKLHDQSIRLTNFHVSPTCAPTRSAIMSGKYPFKSGITHTIFERERMALSNTTLLPHVLKSVGYTTGMFGKWHLGDEDEYQARNRGFDETFSHGAGGIGQAYPGTCADVPDNDYFDPVIMHNGKFVKTEGFCTDVFFQQALTWMKDQKDQPHPFFTYLSLNAPHGPFLAPEEYKQKFIDKGYPEKAQGFYGMVENIDANMGLLMQKLEEWNLDENTILIFMTDNGKTGFGMPNTYNAGMRGMKVSPYEGGTRVPFFIRWPQKLNANVNINTLAGHIDLLPTIAEMTDADISNIEGLDGRSLLPLFNNPETEWEDRYLFFHVARWGKYLPEEEFEKYSHLFLSNYMTTDKKEADPNNHKYLKMAVRGQRFRWVNNEELYDYDESHHKSPNVIDQYPEEAAKMKAAYDEWWASMLPYMIQENESLDKEKPFHVQYYQQKESIGIPVHRISMTTSVE